MDGEVKAKISKRKDYLWTGLSLLGLLFSAVPLFSESVYQSWFGETAFESKKPVIGEISFAKNDIRHKNSDSLSWQKAQLDQNVKMGDSIFTGGRSRSQVTLHDGQNMVMDENSMVTFTKINRIEVPNLDSGNFLVNIKGKMKIGIGGELTEIEGDGSQVQVVLTKKKASIKLLKGTAKLTLKGKTKKMEVHAVVALTLDRWAEARPKRPETVIAGPIVLPAVIPKPNHRIFERVDEFYDFYYSETKSIRLRAERKKYFKFPTQVAWEIQGSVNVVYGQLSGARDFSSVSDTFDQKARAGSAPFRTAFLGENFFRLSHDRKSWGIAQKLEVRSQPLPVSPPKIVFMANKFNILDRPVLLEALFEVDPSLNATVLEFSDSPGFEEKKTRVTWVKNKKFSFLTDLPQTLYFRARGVNSKYQVTAASEVVKIEIDKPPLPLAPHLARLAAKYSEGDLIKFSWARMDRAASYQITVQDRKGRTVIQRKSNRPVLDFRAETKGDYQVSIVAVDSFGRKSAVESQSFRIDEKVAEKIPIPSIAENQRIDREPAQEASLSQKLGPTFHDYFNQKYRSSKLALQGAAFTMVSKEQVESSKPNPTALLVGLQWMGWQGASGGEASFKTKVMDVQTAPGTNATPFQVEARLHRRWTMSWSPFSSLGHSQASIFGGYEYYRNGGQGPFSPKYELLKVGLALEFPLMRRWDTGGEFVYGFGLDKSKKYEISGHIDYYMERDWSLGVGYRVHFFEAGSVASSPFGLPYREGFGEGYSVVIWHY